MVGVHIGEDKNRKIVEEDDTVVRMICIFEIDESFHLAVMITDRRGISVVVIEETIRKVIHDYFYELLVDYLFNHWKNF